MSSRVTPGEVLDRSLAELETHWGRGPFFAAQRRRYEHEREYRRDCAERGYQPTADDWVIAEMRSGEWERRTKRSREALGRDKLRLAQRKYPFDKPPPPHPGATIELGDGTPASVVAAFRRQASRARVHVPEPREPVAPATRSRERRGRRATAPTRGSPDDPHHLAVIPLSAFHAELERALGAA
jgi:hypothetical protein